MKKLLVLLLFVGCSKGEPADFTKVKVGMTEEQVVELVGKPQQSEQVELIPLKVLKYEKHVVSFFENKVTQVQTLEEFSKDGDELRENMDQVNQAIEEYKNMEPAN